MHILTATRARTKSRPIPPRNPIADLTEAVLAVLDEPRYRQSVVTAAPHLSHRLDRDRNVSFADVRRLPDPEWSRTTDSRQRHAFDLIAEAELDPAEQLYAMTEAVPVTDWADKLAAVHIEANGNLDLTRYYLTRGLDTEANEGAMRLFLAADDLAQAVTV